MLCRTDGMAVQDDGRLAERDPFPFMWLLMLLSNFIISSHQQMFPDSGKVSVDISHPGWFKLTSTLPLIYLVLFSSLLWFIFQYQ